MKVFFLSTMPKKPTGGVRVIYSYVNNLRKIGLDSYVLHPLKNYTYGFSDGDSPVYTPKQVSDSDHLVIPDVYIGRATAKNLNGHQNFSLFIQNPYIIRTIQKYNNKQVIENVFTKAKFILCISEDTMSMILAMYPQSEGKLIRTTWALPPESGLSFQQASKEKLITYMPRKNIDHIQLTIDSLEKKLPHGWQLAPIVRMTRGELETALNKSSIYMSFGSFEGLPAPPVEAAIAGNYVVGYHGNGGKEYWRKPNFTEVNVCDIPHFASSVLDRVHIIDSNPSAFRELEEGIQSLNRRFSATYELECVKQFADVLSAAHADIKHTAYRRTPFLTNYFSYQLDRIGIKLKQVSHGL